MKSRVLNVVLVILILVFILVIPTRVHADPDQLFEYYNTGDDAAFSIYDLTWVAQTFTVGTVSHTITSVKIKAYRVGSPGTLTIGIRAVDGNGKPTGGDLTSGTINADTFTTNTGGAWYTISLTEYTLQANTKYGVVARAPGGTLSNRVGWRYDNAGSYNGGNLLQSTNGGSSWTDYASYDCMFEIWGNVLNYTPTNDSGSITDMDDADNLYSQRKWYTGSSVHSDLDGFADIDYCEFRLKQDADTKAIFRYDEDTDTFTCESGSDKWDFDTSGSSASESGNSITITWKFKPQWDATEEADLEIELYVVDDYPASDTDIIQSNYVDVVVTLTVSGFASTPAEYVNPSTSVDFSGSVRYVNDPGSSTASSNYPPDEEFTAVHIHNSTHVSQGLDTTIVNGAFSVSFNSPATVEQYTYHPYIDMSDADYTDADPSGISDTITSEQVKVITYYTSDDRANINANVNIDVTLQYASDSALVIDGTVTINGFSATHQGSGVWRITRTSATVISVTYDTVAASGNARAITSVNQNGKSTTVIWDRIKITGMGNDNGRRNVGSTGTIWATALLEFDNHPLGEGDSLTISSISMSWVVGNNRFEGTDTRSTVQSTTYDTFTSGNEATYGITVGIMDGYSTTIIWDRIEIYFEELDDSRVNIGANIEFRAKARLDWDDHALGSGDSLTANAGAMTWDGANVWFDVSRSQSSVGDYTFQVTSGSEDTYGITAIYVGVTNPKGIWDRVQVTLSISDNRINVSATAEISKSGIYEYDSAQFTGTINLNDTLTKSGVGKYFYTTSSISDPTHGITVFTSNDVYCIFDRIKILTLEADPTNPSVGSYTKISSTAELEYDNHPLGSGDSLTIEGLTLNWDPALSEFVGYEKKESEQSKTYDEGTSSEATYEITVVNMNGKSVTVTWTVGGAPPPPPPPPTPAAYLPTISLDISITEPTTVTYTWWSPTFKMKLLMINKGTIAQDVVVNCYLYSANKLLNTVKTTLFISGLDKKEVEIEFPTPSEAGEYTLKVCTVKPEVKATKTFVVEIHPFTWKVAVLLLAVGCIIIVVWHRRRK